MSCTRQAVRDAIAIAFRESSCVMGAQVSWAHRTATAITLWAMLDGTDEETGSEMGLLQDERTRTIRVSSDQGGLRARVIATAISSNVVTLTTSSAHGFVVGQEIRVAMDTADGAIDGIGFVVTPVTSTTLSYANTQDDQAETTEYGDVEGLIRPGDTITYESEVYRVKSVRADSLRSVYSLDCEGERVRFGGAA